MMLMGYLLAGATNVIFYDGLSPLVKEKWDHLFEDDMAIGESCLAPLLTPEDVDQSVSQVDEIQDKEGGIQDKEGGIDDAYNDCSQ
ncbi:hypothetical protein L6452_15039 [Arctium lappa]|uniref:Uncharacterized protein n=1 Tax=Arctium lappa TaxID=4217 RepID=A0ACB9CMS3_ARCLA|nr:hypothetical protein L6452_15039 [Arctium lappa]